MRSIRYNFIMNIILKMSRFIFPLITFPYVSRVLGAIYNGKIAFATSFISYFAMLAVLGIPTYGVKICAACRDDKDELSKTVHELLIILAVLLSISYVFFFVIIFSVPSLFEDRVLLLISSTTILLTSFGVEWFYQAIEQYGYITYRNITVKIISVILIFVFVKKQKDYILYGIICVLGSVGSNIINLFKLKQYIYFKRYEIYNIKRHIKPILMLFLYVAAVSIYTNLDSVMLKFMANDAQVGYYSAAIKIKLVLQNIVTALGTVLLPKTAYYLQNNMSSKYDKMMRKSFDFVILASLLTIAFFEIEASDCVMLLAGNQYQNAIPAMRWIIPAVLFIGLSSTTGTQILIPSGRDRYATLSAAYGAVVDLIFNWILIPRYGARGAASATLIAEIVVASTQIIVLRKEIKGFIDGRNIVKLIAIIALSVGITILVNTIMKIDIPFVRICITGVVFAGAFLVFAIVLGEKTICHELKKYAKK